MVTERDSVGVHIINSYAVAPASTPLALSITVPAGVNIPVMPGMPGPTLSNAGDVTSTATASGGTTPYTYSWSISEVNDLDGVFAVNSQGTTTNATYNDAIIETSFTQPPPPAPPNPPPVPATYRVSCTVTDGNSDQVTATQDFQVDAV